MKKPGRGAAQGFEATCCGAAALPAPAFPRGSAKLRGASASFSQKAGALSPAATASNAAVCKDDSYDGGWRGSPQEWVCGEGWRGPQQPRGQCPEAKAWSGRGLGWGVQREEWGAGRLSCLPKEDVSHLSLDVRSTNSQEAPPVLPVPPRTRAQLALLTSQDGAPSPGSSLSGALNHSGRRWDVGGGARVREQGQGPQQASGRASCLPAPILSLGKEGRRGCPQGAVTSEAVFTMAPLGAGH